MGIAPADTPWQNEISEALVKSVKQNLKAAISNHVLTFLELRTLCFEVANLVNERPIGKHPTSHDDGTYPCPNDFCLDELPQVALSRGHQILVIGLNLTKVYLITSR